MLSYIIIYEHMYIIGPTFLRINLSKYTLSKYILSIYNFYHCRTIFCPIKFLQNNILSNAVFPKLWSDTKKNIREEFLML